MPKSIAESRDEKKLFLLFFWKENYNEDTRVLEVKEIDFTEIKKHIERGESVFVTQKRRGKLNAEKGASQEATEPWHFTHT